MNYHNKILKSIEESNINWELIWTPMNNNISISINQDVAIIKVATVSDEATGWLDSAVLVNNIIQTHNECGIIVVNIKIMIIKKIRNSDTPVELAVSLIFVCENNL